MNKNFMFRRLSRNGDMAIHNAVRVRNGLILCRVGEHLGYSKAPFPMCFTREALCSLIDTVGVRPPESGAMGFSLADQMGFDTVEFSTTGSANSGGAVYRPDAVWGAQRQTFHLNAPVDPIRLWSGDIHSHPGGYAHPSPKSGSGLGDLGYVEEVFAMNEWMEWFLLPILTGTGTDEVVIHPWVCRRGRVLPVEMMIADLQVCSVARFPKRICNPEWERRWAENVEERVRREAEVQTTEEQTVTFASVAVTDSDSPVVIVLAGNMPQTVQQNPVLDAPKEDAKQSAGEANAGMTADNQQPREQSSDRQHGAEMSPPAQINTLADVDAMLGEYTRRLKGIVSPSFREKTILVIGVGAGSYAVEKLSRLCPKAIRICDFDTVEVPNLARTAYTVKDAVAQRLKVDALTLRVREVNPWVEIRPYSTSITRMSQFQIDEMFEGVDILIGGTDSLDAQALINQESVRRGIPAVFIGIHAGAQGGRIIWSLPSETPCYRCVARDRFEISDLKQAEAADLTAATGSIFDCQFIDMLAMKIAVSILERDQNSAMGRFFIRMGCRTEVVIRCDPDYEWGQALWAAVLGDLPKTPKDFARELNENAFLAMDSIWLKTACDPHCPVCEGGKRKETPSKTTEDKNPALLKRSNT